MLLNKKRNSKIPPKALTAVLKPKPRIKFGINASRYFTSSMDSSDGLSTTLNEMAKQSKKKFVVNKIPINKDLDNYLKNQKIDSKSIVFHGGEEYEFVFTIPSKFKAIIMKNAKILKTPIFEIGYVTVGNGVYLKNQMGETKLEDLGWKHFK